jgi:uncharacterized membrane protein
VFRSGILDFARIRRVSKILMSRPTIEGALMGDTHDDPTDHSRTTQPHAGIAMKDNFFWPGLILLVVAMFGLIATAATAAYRHYEWLFTTLLVAVLGAVAGALWLIMENRRVTRIEAQWDTAHPGRRTRPRTR